MHDLDPLDPDYVQDVLSKPPFINIPGVINVRDLGNYVSVKEPGQVTKPRYFIRSAELSAITEEGGSDFTVREGAAHGNVGKNKIKELGITKVFDLRSDTEIRKYNTPLPEIDGVEVIHMPVFKTEDYSPEMMAKYVRARIFVPPSPILKHVIFARRYQLYASGKTEASTRLVFTFSLNSE